jgi:hypothetical protein
MLSSLRFGMRRDGQERKGWPSAERERLWRGCLLARLKPCPSGFGILPVGFVGGFGVRSCFARCLLGFRWGHVELGGGFALTFG